MATSGEGFAAGLRAGGGLVSQALENQRLDAKEARDAEDYKQRVADRDRTNKAWDDYSAATAPKVTATGLQVAKDVYGQTPEQAAGPAGAAQRAAGDIPDSSDLQDVPARGGGLPTGSPVTPPAAGAAPAASPFARTAADVGTTAPSRLEQEQAMQGLSTKLRDVQGIRTSQQEQVKLKQDQIYNIVGKMTDDEIVARAKTLNTNDSNVPILYTGKGKGGYDFMTMDPDGTPGKKFSMNIAQMRQMVVSQELGKADMGREALALATSTHKDVGEAISKWNEATAKMQQGNTTALHNANSDANDAARLGIARANAERQANQDKVANSKYFVDPKTGENYITMPTVGKDGIKVQTFQLNNDGSTGKPVPLPPGAQPVGAKGGRTGPDKEAPAEGSVQVRSDGTTYRADGRGGEMHLEGVAPSMREGTLAKMGFSKDEIATLPFNADGVHIEFNGQGYSVRSKADMKQLRTDIDWAEHNRIKGEEETRVINNAVPNAERTSAMQSRIGTQQGLPMFPDPNAPQRPNW